MHYRMLILFLLIPTILCSTLQYGEDDYEDFMHPLTLNVNDLLQDERYNGSEFKMAVVYPVFHNFTVFITVGRDTVRQTDHEITNCFSVDTVPEICMVLNINSQTTLASECTYYFNIEKGYLKKNAKTATWQGKETIKVQIPSRPDAPYFTLKITVTREGMVYGNDIWIGELQNRTVIIQDEKRFDVYRTKLTNLAYCIVNFPLEGYVVSTQGSIAFLTHQMAENQEYKKDHAAAPSQQTQLQSLPPAPTVVPTQGTTVPTQGGTVQTQGTLGTTQGTVGPTQSDAPKVLGDDPGFYEPIGTPCDMKPPPKTPLEQPDTEKLYENMDIQN
ncbi:unnamed protein product [Bursaphelenchus okinawaensis]|uniref:Galectin n=1 Tax=Bursaphelenchus okinawaensis TaxID=465554 RepID=A0A811L807_9BILA|nr:unnamed protein product [Bursaphelenchus okinawaensis]CAG9118951.1 unnamed protein product [Bursaphelenchus okinawaensis]